MEELDGNVKTSLFGAKKGKTSKGNPTKSSKGKQTSTPLEGNASKSNARRRAISPQDSFIASPNLLDSETDENKENDGYSSDMFGSTNDESTGTYLI